MADPIWKCAPQNVSPDGNDQGEDVVAKRELNLKFPDATGKIIEKNVYAKVLRGQDIAYAAVAFTFEHQLDPKQACIRFPSILVLDSDPAVLRVWLRKSIAKLSLVDISACR